MRVTDRTDIASQYRRQVSQEWWNTQRRFHRLTTSLEVLNELGDQDFKNREQALEMIAGLELLQIDGAALQVAKVLVAEKVMPGPIAGDALHVAIACSYGVDFLIIWNVKHRANQNKLVHLRTICQRLGLIPVQIVTPELLWE